MSIFIIPSNKKIDDKNYNPDILGKTTNMHIHVNLRDLLRKTKPNVYVFIWTSEYHCSDDGNCVMFGGYDKFEQERIYYNCEDYGK